MKWNQYESTTSNCFAISQLECYLRFPIPGTVTEKDIIVSNDSIRLITYILVVTVVAQSTKN